MNRRFGLGYRILAIIIVIGLVFTFDSMAYASATVVKSGVIRNLTDYDDQGEAVYGTVNWTLWSDGRLNLSGNGIIENNDKFDYNEDDFRTEFGRALRETKKLDISKGVKFDRYCGVFSNLPELEEVTIADAGTELTSGLFEYNENLMKVVLPDGYKSIPAYCFEGCKKLSDVNITDSVENIYDCAFFCCPIKKLNLKHIKTLGYCAFANNSALTSVTLPNSITEVAYSFANDNKLADIVLESGVKISAICGRGYEGAFSRTAWEENQDGNLYIGNGYYGYKGDLDENSTLEIKEGTSGICQYAFSGIKVRNLKLPTTITDFGDHPFTTDNEEFYIKNDWIGRYGYKIKTSIENILIPSKVADVEYNVVRYTGVKNIFAMSGTRLAEQIAENPGGANFYPLDKSILQMNVDNKDMAVGEARTAGVNIIYGSISTDFSAFVEWSSSDPNVITVDKNGIISAVGSGTANVIASLPYMNSQAVVAINVPGDKTTEAPTEAPTVAAVETPSDVKIGDVVKEDSGKFTCKVTGKNTVSINKYNKKGTKVVIPAKVRIKKKTFKVTAISNNAFKGKKKLKTIIIGKNITRIGGGAFSGCKGITKIIIKSKKIKKIGKNAFKGIGKKAIIKIPKNKKKIYKKLLKKSKLGGSVKVK